MFSEIPLFKLYDAMARHAAESQAVSAQNIAHAGQPGYRAMQVEPFSAYVARTSLMDEGAGQPSIKQTLTGDMVSPNGNSVSLEAELMRSVSAADQHRLAMTVYSKSMDLLRGALGKRM
jgi:flagellar basal-body rod protein FlgB